MKTKIINAMVALFLITGFLSCNDNDDVVAPPPIPVSKDGFFYAEGGATSMSTVSTPYANAAANRILAIDTGTSVIEINLWALVIGVYTIDATNTFTYYKPGTAITWTGHTGTVTITRNENNKLSGTFDINSGNGSPMINQVNGTFRNIVINP